MPACHVDAYMLSVRALARATIVVLPGRTCNLPLGLLSRDVTHKTIAISTLDMDIYIFNTMINTYTAMGGGWERTESCECKNEGNALCVFNQLLVWIYTHLHHYMNHLFINVCTQEKDNSGFG